MSDDNVVSSRIEFDVIDNTVAEAKKAYQEVTGEILKAEVAAEEFSETMEKNATAVIRAAKKEEDALRQVREEIERTAEAEEKRQRVQTRQGRAGTRQVGFAVARVGGFSDAARQAQQLTDVGAGLKDMAAGAKSAIKASGGLTKSMVAMGVAGIATAITLAAVVLVMKDMLAASTEQATQLGAVVNATRELNREVAAGLTTEQAQQQISDLNQARQDEKEILAELREGMEGLESAVTNVGVTIGGVFFPSVQQLNKEIARSSGLVAGYGAKIEGLSDVIEDGTLAVNNAKAAEVEAAKEAEEAARELEEAERAQAQAAKEAAAAVQEAVDANRKYVQAVADVATDLSRSLASAQASAAQASADISSDAIAEAQESARAFNDARLEADIDFFEESQKAQRENIRALQEIIRQGTRDEEDLLEERNFLAVDKNTKAARRALEDVAIAATAENEERVIAAQENLEEMRRQFAIDARERKINVRERRREQQQSLASELRAIQEASNQKLLDLKTSLERELELISQGASKKLELESEFWAQSIGIVQKALSQLGVGPISNITGGTVFNNNVAINGSNFNASELQNTILNMLSQTGLT